MKIRNEFKSLELQGNENLAKQGFKRKIPLKPDKVCSFNQDFEGHYKNCFQPLRVATLGGNFHTSKPIKYIHWSLR